MNAALIALRLVLLLLVILAATWAAHSTVVALDLDMPRPSERAMYWSVVIAIGVFIVLLAIPFVPGAEIGLTLLTMFGATVAPVVYGAAVVAMMLSYLVGHVVPPHAVARGLRTLRLRRAAAVVDAAAALPRERRLAMLMGDGAPGLLRLAARHRYLAVLLAINLPGNILIGGGGGIALMAGMSGLFAPLPFLLTVALAVAPVPLMIVLFGP